jgi:hypothetical protein
MDMFDTLDVSVVVIVEHLVLIVVYKPNQGLLNFLEVYLVNFAYVVPIYQ